MTKEYNKSPYKAPQGDSDPWIDVHNDELMVQLGIRPPHYVPNDSSVWSKTTHERNLLNSVRNNSTRMYFHSVPSKYIPVKAKLIIYLKKNKKFPNTTYSRECYQHEIDSILLKYSDGGSLVSKYTFNGRTYKPNERPFWY